MCTAGEESPVGHLDLLKGRTGECGECQAGEGGDGGIRVLREGEGPFGVQYVERIEIDKAITGCLLIQCEPICWERNGLNTLYNLLSIM